MISPSTRAAGDVIAEIKMSMTSFPGAFFLVEGPTDSRFIRHLIRQTNFQVVICGAKSTVIGSVRGIQALGGIKVLGFVDNDFDRVLGTTYTCGDLFSTDTHDLETMLLSSEAWTKVIAEYTDPSKVAALEIKEKRSLRELLIERAQPFGELRLISALKRLSIDFSKSLSPWKFVSPIDWSLDKDKLHSDFCALASMNKPDLIELIKTLPNISNWDLINGHDAMAILAAGLRSPLLSRTQMSEEKISSAFRLAYGQEMFYKTALCNSFINWGKKSGLTVIN